jgi:hypothetical protein
MIRIYTKPKGQARAGRVPGARHAATQYNMLQRSAAHSPFSAT